MIRVLALSALFALSGCAATSEEHLNPDYSFQKDVSIGLEAESIGNWSLARAFLERGLEMDDRYRDQVLFEDQPILDEAARNQAIEALARIYYEQRELDLLFEHLHRYWQVADLRSVPWVPGEVIEKNKEVHLTWYCRLLDDHNRFSEAQACWAKVGDEEKSRASIRAFELQEVFTR